MKKTFSKFSSLIILATSFALLISSCKKDHNSDNNNLCGPIPDLLKVPAGNKLVLHSYGKGSQIYQVQRSATDPNAYVWVNTAPSATIYANPDFTKQLALHFAGPTWDFSDGPIKGQKVVAAKLQAVTNDATAIPWLLLKTVDSLSVNNKVTYVQRLCTVGGLAPTTGADEQHLGQQVSIPYTASYLFYEAEY